MLPGEFQKKYNYKKLYGQIFYSNEAERFYVLHKNHRIYMKKGWSKEQAASTFCHWCWSKTQKADIATS